MSGGGGSSPSSQTVYNSSLPEYAKPYFEDVMRRSQTISNEPYQPYTGQRLAGKSADTTSGLSAMRSYAGTSTPYQGYAATAGQYGQDAAAVGDQFANYNMPGYAGSMSYYDGQQIGVNGQDVTGDFNSAAAQKYMSPYMDEVVSRAQDDMYEEYQMNANASNANAASAGAFGGSRAALMQARLNADYQDRAGDYAAQARQAAFENAQGQFERDRAARMGLASQNQAIQQFAAEYGLSEEQVRQAALTGQLGAIDQAGTALDRQAQMQQLYDKSTVDRANALLGVGQTEEAYKQDQLDVAYQDFVNQRDYDKNQLAFYASAIKGVPVNLNSDVMTYQRSNPLLGVLGGIGALGSLGGLGGAA